MRSLGPAANGEGRAPALGALPCESGACCRVRFDAGDSSAIMRSGEHDGSRGAGGSNSFSAPSRGRFSTPAADILGRVLEARWAFARCPFRSDRAHARMLYEM